MFKRKSSLNQEPKRWLLIKSEINKYIHKIFKKNPLLESENYCYWKKNRMFFNIASLESYNFYEDETDDSNITIENKPTFLHNKALLIINFKDKTLSLKTKNYSVDLNPMKIEFLKKHKNIVNKEFSTYRPTIHLTNIFICGNYFFKFLSIEPIKLAIILNIINKISKTRFLYLHQLKGVVS